jgi:N-acetylglucosaminyldiphosphoundecaprenol N-acetyl-beta-D-mannosaminyltransferase
MGHPIGYLDAEEAVARIAEWAGEGSGGYICVPNAHVMVTAQDDPAFAAALRHARLLLPDSTILQKARQFLYPDAPAPKTLFGADLMEALCAAAAARNIPIGLHGGTPETLVTLREILTRRFPDLTIAYAVSPPFAPVTQKDAEAAAQRIAASGARLVFLGIGAPKQEIWMQAASAHMPQAVAIGVGAAFATLAGSVPRPPRWIHSAGLTWAFRFAQEPGRLWRRYLNTSPRFAWAVLQQKLAPRANGLQ